MIQIGISRNPAAGEETREKRGQKAALEAWVSLPERMLSKNAGFFKINVHVPETVGVCRHQESFRKERAVFRPGIAARLRMNQSVKNMTTAALMLALGLVLPFLTGQIPSIGSQLCPMHIPVLLCGFLCGWKYGLGVGFILPLLRSALFGMPIMYPAALAMAFELGTYGMVSGWLWQISKYQCTKALYRCLIAAMLAGRIVWGLVMMLLLGIGQFTWQAFLGAAFVTTLPGIVLQLILIPMIMVALHRAGVIHFRRQAV